MAKYQYPAIIKQEEGAYSVCFPDLESCVSCGGTIEEALLMAEDALSLFLYDMEQEGAAIPAPTPLDSIACEDCVSHARLIEADTGQYQEKYCRCKKCHQ